MTVLFLEISHDYKATAKIKIDEAAEKERLKYITDGAGQAAVYSAKAEEALACLADPSPLLADYPFLAAEIGINGADLTEVANTILAIKASWKVIASTIENIRLTAKNDIDGATSRDVIDAIVGGVTWPS
jgi:hypothetical protein